MYRALILSLLLTLSAPARTTIRITPSVVMAGGTIRVTCHTPRAADNRTLTIAIVGYQSSQVQLDGLEAPMTREVLFTHVPCETETAMCEVTTVAGVIEARTAAFEVAGCESGGEVKKDASMAAPSAPPRPHG
jgi:hypothetical protein